MVSESLLWPLLKESITAGIPLRVSVTDGVSTSSDTTAISPRVIRLPSGRTSTSSFSNSLAVLIWPSDRTRNAPSARLPAGTSSVVDDIAAEISFSESPSRDNSFWLISILIISSGRPVNSILSTPSLCKSSLISLAILRKAKRSKGPEITSLLISS